MRAVRRRFHGAGLDHARRRRAGPSVLVRAGNRPVHGRACVVLDDQRGEEGAEQRAEPDQLERVADHDIKTRYPRDPVQRVALLQPGDEPVIEPCELLVRMFIPAPNQPDDYPESLAGWEETHRTRWSRSGGNSHCGSPPAWLLEFAFHSTSAVTPPIMMRDVARWQLSGCPDARS